MKSTHLLLLLQGAATALAQDFSIDFDVILPSEVPTGTSDPPQCATKNASQYFEFPMPTGVLQYEILDYGGQLSMEPCTVDGEAYQACLPPFEYDHHCGISTAAPSSILPEYSSWASDASSWWSEHSSAAHEVASECPHSWLMAMLGTYLGGTWLNTTLAHAQCIARAAQITGDSTAASPTATSGSGVKAGEPAETDKPNGAGRVQGFDVWMAAIGLAAVSMTTW